MTCFGPFLNVKTNVTEAVAHAVVASGAAQAVVGPLTVDTDLAMHELSHALEQHGFDKLRDAVVLLGHDEEASHVRWEPHAYRYGTVLSSTLPSPRHTKRGNLKSIGTYVCNALYYDALNSHMRCTFVHVGARTPLKHAVRKVSRIAKHIGKYIRTQ